MSDHSRFAAWQAGCRDLKGYGQSHSDTFYLGNRNYVQPFPCPNGLPVIDTSPSDCEVFQRRISKAKQDIEDYSREIRVREAAGIIPKPQIVEDIRSIKEWLTSLFSPQ